MIFGFHLHHYDGQICAPPKLMLVLRSIPLHFGINMNFETYNFITWITYFVTGTYILLHKFCTIIKELVA